ncbi:MFS transporter [Streptomyces albus subsp. chlorinus]|uniref:CynX/NimT family MFS transporter n=1 Tax=Streptomyces albus TaxID=1888 RepID=UPI001570843E|nr:MFS transporter [Streptomyces albus]NSC20928.1 MFS transporter [Streptomyces albus subsp. chlorinus]
MAMADDDPRNAAHTTDVSTRTSETGVRTAPERTTAAPAPPPGSAGAAPVPSRWMLRFVIAGLVIAALNLRPAISGLGPLLEEVRDGLGMNGTVAGLLTSVPPLCFAVFGGLAPRLARRWGPATVVLAGMVAVTLGLALRPFASGTGTFLAATALALAGIALSNVLMPVVVKHWFPDRVGSMTGLYSMALALGTSAAAAVTVPMTDALGGSWRVGLGAWAVLGALAVLPWAVVSRDRSARAPEPQAAQEAVPEETAEGEARTEARARSEARAGAAPALRIAKSPTAWSLGVFFGLQASAAYITMGWLPQIFRDAGVSASAAGVMLAVTMGMGIPLSFVLPKLAARMRHQGPLVLALGACGLIAYAGLWFAPASGAWVWALVLGISNCAFPLALTMIGMRSRSSAGVVKLSAFAQSTGYLISIPGPLLVGALHDASGGWHVPILLMAALMVAQMATGLLAGRDRVIEDGR